MSDNALNSVVGIAAAIIGLAGLSVWLSSSRGAELIKAIGDSFSGAINAARGA